jgi:chromate transporter
MKHISSVLEVARIFLKLGLTSFGGPIAHLGYFREEFVNRRKWLDEKAFADLVALCQFLPGPASSQVGIAIGNLRAGFSGGLRRDRRGLMLGAYIHESQARCY